MDTDGTEAGLSLASIPMDFAEEIVIVDGDVDSVVPDTLKKMSGAVTVYRLMKREEAEALGISLQEGSVTNPNESTTVITRQTINMSQRFSLIKVEETAAALDYSLDVETANDSSVFVRTDDSNPKLRFGCGTCPKRFRHLSHLRRHEKSHTGERPFLCDDCPKAFADASTLLRHSRTHCSTRAYACHTCGKAFAAAGALRRHAAVHDPAQRRYPCMACAKRFPDKAAYRKHLLTHGDVRPYACNACDKRFFHVGDLNGHRKIHDLVKPHTCPHCHREFVKHSNYARHLQIHEGEKQFACHVCHVSYNFQASLTRHLLTHVSRTQTDPSSPHVLILQTDPAVENGKVTLSSIRRLLDENQLQLTNEALWDPDEGAFRTQGQEITNQHPKVQVQIFHEAEPDVQFHEAETDVQFHEAETEVQFHGQESYETEVQEVVEVSDAELVDSGARFIDSRVGFIDSGAEGEERCMGAVAEEVVYEIKVLDVGDGRVEIVTGR